MEKKCRIEVTKFAEKQLSRLPNEILEAFLCWEQTIMVHGLRKMRMSRGYRDEALKGVRTIQRSSRLNRSYRIIYREVTSVEFVVICILEVNKHEY